MNELKRIFHECIGIIKKKGFTQFLKEAKTKISRREFRIISPIIVNKDIEVELKMVVKKNRKKRLKIKKSNSSELTKDKILISDDYLFDDSSLTKSDKEVTICTIISSNYLAYARTLTESFLKYHPHGKVFVLLVDELDEKFIPENEKFSTVYLDQIGLPDLDSFLFKYSILEQNTDVKAHFLKFLFERYQLEKVIYFDPDILFTNSIENLWNALNKKSIILIPHITHPIDDGKKPSELELIQSGTYNLGFLALSNNQTTKNFLEWWKRHLLDYGYIDIQKGMFVDQKWVDLVPAIFDDVFVLKHPGYNSAYWNLMYKHFNITDGKIYVNNKPLYFFHFSGFSPENMEDVSKHQNRFQLKDLQNIRPLFELYRDMLVENGYLESRKFKFQFDYFDNGIKIPLHARRIFAQAIKKNLKFGNPFHSKGTRNFLEYLNEGIDNHQPPITRLWYQIYLEREDLQSRYPDIFYLDRIDFIKKLENILHYEYNVDQYFLPSNIIQNFERLENISKHVEMKTSFPKSEQKKIIGKKNKTGINIAGYFKGEFGIAEAARGYARALKSVNVNHVLNNVTSPAHRNEDDEFNKFEIENPFPINLIAVNADQSEVFFQSVEDEYFKNKYNIGLWFWEISDFPDKFQSSFKYYDEIWVATNFVVNSISKSSPIPVVKVNGPLDTDFSSVNSDKEKFGFKKDQSIFLFIFDFYSIFERKNPLGIISAFRMAFKENENVCLAIKCINGDKFPNEYKKLLENCVNDRIRLIPEHMEKSELLSLIASSDCYVSLHRSEGLGLTIAEAMLAKKPVIATDYGGNIDFMNVNNSLPVKYKIVELDKDYGPYAKGSIWAEPDINHAAILMKYVFENKDIANEIGKSGYEYLKKNRNSEKCGQEIKKRIELIERRFN